MANDKIPVTVVSSTDNALINLAGKTAPWPAAAKGCLYLMLVVDRSNLTIVANEFCSDFQTVPPVVKQFGGNTNYLLLVASYKLIPSMVPQGDLLAFLVANGPGKELGRAVQVCQVLDPATNYFNYCHIGVMGTKEGKDLYSLHQRQTLALPMHLLQLGGRYTPVEDYG
ncbi:MAG: hypothetical protein HGA96_17535 [Desulfobulbaceae bacterium]|nr:hypothetical protein [Desulfobulbaceae bacterium]